MLAHHSSGTIARASVSAFIVCVFCRVAEGQAAAQTQNFVIHGTPKTCTAITQLDSALASDSQQFFAGWTEKDYSDAVAWSQACAEYGWHVPGHPRLPLLQAQHDRALGTAAAGPGTAAGALAASPPIPATAQTASDAASGSAAPTPPAQNDLPAQAQIASSAASGSTAPNPAVQVSAAPAQPPIAAAAESQGAAPEPPVPGTAAAPVAPPNAADSGPPDAPAQPELLTSAPPGNALPASAVQVTPPMRIQAGSEGEGVGTVPGARTHERAASDDADSLLTEEFFKKHFHQESLWVAHKANLDLGENREGANWPSGGNSAQLKNRLTADRIVLYCAKKTNGGKAEGRPLLWDLRWCESEEASAYNRLVSGGEFPGAGRDVVFGCAGEDSYVYLERCMQTLFESAKR